MYFFLFIFKHYLLIDCKFSAKPGITEQLRKFVRHFYCNDIEKIIENIVYQHLVRLGYKVTIGELLNAEIDFVCTRANDTRYVQAAYLIADDTTFSREFGNLLQIRDNNPKYVISMTPQMETSSYKGVKHIALRDFLREGFDKAE